MMRIDSSDVCTQYSYDKDVPARTLKRGMPVSDMTTVTKAGKGGLTRVNVYSVYSSAECIGAGTGLGESTASPE